MKHSGWGMSRASLSQAVTGQDKNYVKGDVVGVMRDRARLVEDRNALMGVKVLMKDGVWLVPVGERFEGWEKINVNESN